MDKFGRIAKNIFSLAVDQIGTGARVGALFQTLGQTAQSSFPFSHDTVSDAEEAQRRFGHEREPCPPGHDFSRTLLANSFSQLLYLGQLEFGVFKKRVVAIAY